MVRRIRHRKGPLPRRSAGTMLIGMSDNVQVEGSGAWAADMILRGHGIRSRGWFTGSVHLLPPEAGKSPCLFFRSGKPDDKDAPVGEVSAFFARHSDEVWELADKPRRATASSSTLIDLALFPDAMAVATVRALLEKLEQQGDDLGDLIAFVWQSTGQTLIGQALRAFLQHDQMRIQVQLARQGDPRVRAEILTAIAALRDGR